MGSAASGVQKPTPHSAPSSAPPKPIALPSLIPFASCSHPHKRRGWLSQTRGEQLPDRRPAQKNTSSTKQTATAVNLDTDSGDSVAINTAVVYQSNLQIGSLGYGPMLPVFQINYNLVEQSALALNYKSPGSTATAFNNLVGEQLNSL